VNPQIKLSLGILSVQKFKIHNKERIMTEFQQRAYILALISSIVLFCALAMRLLPVRAAHVPFLNLDFEVPLQHTPCCWYITGTGFSFTLDTVDFHSGNQSLRIDNMNATATTRATASQSFPIQLVRGKRVRIRGWMKTANNNGAAGLWWRVDGPNGTISLDNAPARHSLGNTEWTRYEFEREVSTDGMSVSWGMFVRGAGTAWFDNLEVFIDGVPIEQGPPWAIQPLAVTRR